MLPWEVHKKESELLSYANTIGISTDKISDKNLFLQVFVHKSFAADYKHMMDHNERLEFLGDGILWAIINKLLFLHYPDRDESELTLYKIALVREENLALVAREIQLDKYIFVSKGEEKMEGRKKNTILADCLESLIGFLYIDLGSEATEKFVTQYVYSQIDIISKDPVKSYKTMIQEIVQKTHKELPVYEDSSSKTDDKGNTLEYKSIIYVLGQKQSEWFWPNKKKAQEEAAKNYYVWLEGITSP